ncbi:aspartyl protease family protein [Aureivirga marina]|uniref:aspartyl protease family protein n=1 Tax=Aureivirga marina TaxID=1182451 RepID=UPI0018C9A713|nr:aspartyl protease family protein [Aureivirga marina]
MKQKILAIILGLSLFYSCGLKTRSILHSGYVENEQFSDTISFDYTYGVPIVNVKIDEEEYRFLFDTGAPTVIDISLAEKMKYHTLTEKKVFDSQGNREKEKFIKIPSLQINSISFVNIGAVISNMNQTFEISCLEIDGIIGANLMEKAHWKIDYKKRELYFSSKPFPKPINAYTLDFYPQKNQRTPKVAIKLDAKTVKNISVDTGSNGAIDLESKDFPDILNNTKDIFVYGTASTGVYGRGENDIKTLSKIKNITLGNIVFHNQIVSFETNTSKTIGNQFLENYSVIFNWDEKKIYLSPISTYDYKNIQGFGFYTKMENGKLKVASVIENSLADEFGIRPEMEIISINNQTFENTIQNPCFYVFHTPFPKTNEIKVSFLIQNQKQTFTFYRQDFL